MPSGYNAQLPVDTLLDTAILYIGSAMWGASTDALKATPTQTIRNVPFAGKRSAVAGLDRIVEYGMKFDGTFLPFGTAQIKHLMHEIDPVTVGGVSTWTPIKAGVQFDTTKYVGLAMLYFQRANGGFVRVVMPKAIVIWNSLDGNDPGEGLSSVTVEARSDLAAGGTTDDPPYSIDLTDTTFAAPATVEELVAAWNAAGPSTMSTGEHIEAGRNHPLTDAVSVDPIPPVSGSGASDWAEHAVTGAGLKYDATAGMFHPGGVAAIAGATASSPGTVASQTNAIPGLSTPHLSFVGILFLYEAHDNANSYEWGVRSVDGTQSLNRQNPPGGQNPKWSTTSENGPSMGSSISGRGEIPYNDAAKHLMMVEFGSWQSVLSAPAGQHYRYTKLIIDRDVGAARGDTGDGFTSTSMKLVVGQANPGGDQPGSYRWRNIARYHGTPSPAQYDVAWNWAKARGVAARPKSLVVGVGNSYVAGINVGTEAMFKRLLADLGTRADFMNCGRSGAVSTWLLDSLSMGVEKTFLSNQLRPATVAFWFEWLNDAGGLTGAQMVANAKQWCTNALAINPALKIVMTTPINWDPTNSTFTTRALDARTLILAQSLGVYWHAVVDWMDPASMSGDGSWVGNATWDDGTRHPTQAFYDWLIATGTHPLITGLSPLIPT